ncbi:MAG TPA: ABC transporter permease [Thermoleophilia bacterium]|nr:ABC transporter permease [Thermoleophilia bacterium]
MSTAAYTRFELLRTFRSKRFFLFSLGFPLVLYFLIAGPNRNVTDFVGTGISAPLYYMLGLIAFGTMAAMLSSGARIAGEREAGWNRQLRLTPLRPRSYFRAKVTTAYTMAGVTIALLYLAGTVLGVRLPVDRWLEMTGLVLVGLIPFAALGIFVGHLLTVDSIGPVVGGTVSLLAFISGTWFPIGSHGVLHAIAQFLPSYWLVQASRVAVGGHPWGALGWIVVAVWSVALTALSVVVYERDTARV